MGGKGSKGSKGVSGPKPSSFPHARTFAVQEQEFKVQGFIVVHDLQIYFEAKDTDVVKGFDISTLRSYGQNGNEFSFMTGRKARTNPSTLFTFNVRNGDDIHGYLKNYIASQKDRFQSNSKSSSSSSFNSVPPPLPPPNPSQHSPTTAAHDYSLVDRPGYDSQAVYNTLDTTTMLDATSRQAPRDTYDTLANSTSGVVEQTYDSLDQSTSVSHRPIARDTTYDSLNHR